MLQATLDRVTALDQEGFHVQPPLLICNQEHRFLVREQTLELGVVPAAIYLEPAGRNTAPAVALAALHLCQGETDGVDPLMLVLPADHVVENEAAFAAAVGLAAPAALQGYLVTFGISPSSPETGYGYIKAGKELTGCRGVRAIASFVEKPNQKKAEQYLAEGDYCWNSGMFLFTARRYLEELGAHRPDILDAATRAWHSRATDLDFCRPGTSEFLTCPAESIDYAVMQTTKRGAVVPADMGWSDVGSWDSLWRLAPKSPEGNVTFGDVYLADTRNSYVRSENRLVAVMGVDDVVVVETADAVLVMHKSKSQEIKKAIEHLTASGRREHMEHLRVYRPWGWYEGVDEGQRFQVKRIMVKPGQKLSLQMHYHRAEHWVVVSGTAKVTVNGDERLIGENQSTFIPLGQVHRLENPGKIDLHIIEVQSGAYLGEDDIVRFADNYGRDYPVVG